MLSSDFGPVHRSGCELLGVVLCAVPKSGPAQHSPPNPYLCITALIAQVSHRSSHSLEARPKHGAGSLQRWKHRKHHRKSL